MSIFKAIKVCLFDKYYDFSDRAIRSEFWFFYLFNTIMICILTWANEYAGALWFLGTVVPMLSAATRRLHDTNRSGKKLFVLFAPIVGEILLLIWLLDNSDPNDNIHGPSPYRDKNGINGNF